jgi:hypothetical protein
MKIKAFAAVCHKCNNRSPTPPQDFFVLLPLLQLRYLLESRKPNRNASWTCSTITIPLTSHKIEFFILCILVSIALNLYSKELNKLYGLGSHFVGLARRLASIPGDSPSPYCNLPCSAACRAAGLAKSAWEWMQPPPLHPTQSVVRAAVTVPYRIQILQIVFSFRW